MWHPRQVLESPSVSPPSRTLALPPPACARARSNTHRLNDDLADIHNIMKKNINEVLNRGERLDRE